MGNLNISIDGLKQPVYRPHRNDLVARGGVYDQFVDLEVCTLPSIDSQVGAIGWFLHHGYKGSIQVSQIRGLRLRSGNIQVGGPDLLQDFFPEPRFNSWAVGEIHTIDKRIVPNGRRDHYEQNGHFNNLTNQLSPVARQISARCRQSSIIRNLLRDFERRATLAGEKLTAIKLGGLGHDDRQKQLLHAEELVSGMRKIVSREALPSESQKFFKNVLDKIKRRRATARRHTRPVKSLAKLPPVRKEATNR